MYSPELADLTQRFNDEVQVIMITCACYSEALARQYLQRTTHTDLSQHQHSHEPRMVGEFAMQCVNYQM